MLLTIEISSPFQPRPSLKVTRLDGKKAYTFTWLWFQLAYLPITMYRLIEKRNSGEMEWQS